MLRKSSADLHFVFPKEPIPTVEIDVDTLPAQCHGCADVLQKSLSTVAAKHSGMVATIYIHDGPSVNFGKQTYSTFMGVAGPESLLTNIFDAFSSLGGVNVRYSDDIRSSDGRRDVHIEDGKVWLAEDCVTWYAD